MRHDGVKHLRNTNTWTILKFMRANCYKASTCFGAVISPSSENWHKNVFKTYSNNFDLIFRSLF